MAGMQPEKRDIIEGMDPGETKLYEVRKHWFGLVIVYFEVGVGFAAVVALLALMTPIIFPNAEPGQRRSDLAVIVAVGALVTWLILVLFTYIYRQSKLIISDKNLTQIIQSGLFSRKVSELSMSNVEDVTAEQKGIFASIFNYGVLEVETAGAQENFQFVFCPNPNFYGKIVLEARQKYLETHPHQHHD